MKLSTEWSLGVDANSSTTLSMNTDKGGERFVRPLSVHFALRYTV